MTRIKVRVVKPSRGASWWSEGFRTFTSNPWAWIGIMVIFVIIAVLISLVPFVGDLGHSLLIPVFVGGLMFGCSEINRGETLKVAHLFEGFKGAHFVPLLLIGALNIALTLLMFAVVAAGAFGGASLFENLRMGTGDPYAALLQSTTAIGLTGVFALLVGLVIVAVMGTLNWFAPALVVLHGAGAKDAMVTSFISCWRNWLPFLVYGLVGLALFLAALLVLGTLGTALGYSIWSSQDGLGAMIGIAILVMSVVALMALVVGPVVFGTTYAGYRDTLADDGSTQAGSTTYR